MFDEFVEKEDLPFYTSGACFVLGSIYFQEGMKDLWVTYDVFVRDLPENRNYLVFSGLENIIHYLLDYKLTKDQLSYLKKSYGFPPAVMKYYRQLRFSGNVWAMPEGSLFFANEPVMTISAPIIEAQLIERFIINRVMVYTVLASKISRFVIAAGQVSCGLNYTRAQGIEASNISLRSAKIVGAKMASIPYISQKHKLKPDSGGTTHAYISSFPTEEAALRTYAKYCRGKGLWLLDTYDAKKGLDIFIKVASELKKKKKFYPPYVLFDSGDLVKQSKVARKLLDRTNLKDVKIMLLSNLNEHRVKKMNQQGAAADYYVAGEELTTSPDAPKLSVVYKLSEVIKNGQPIPKMKLSVGKVSLPGKKQVFRQIKNGRYSKDIVGLEAEKIKGQRLLLPMIEKGKLRYNLPTPEEINRRYEKERKKFFSNLFSISHKTSYQVKISPELAKLTQKTKKTIYKVHYDL
ncbi:MAG: nicotinate phosphoribosyltransferase [Patescibacteria group bacterium]|jgi:nicotinate phosphoribosyltransferase